MSVSLGCIADDLTGATDLAMILMREGMRVVQVVGAPDLDNPAPVADAVVVALKSRTVPVNEALDLSLQACDWLQKIGSHQIFFKYCSTFDSTSKGNIGPVTDALMKKLNAKATIACPAFPENGRTVYNGYLFVNDGLLSESSLRNHPLTPMNDSNLKRVLSTQSTSQINNINYCHVDQGSEVIAPLINETIDGVPTIHIVDAIKDSHLREIGHACAELKLVTGGSAVAQGLPDNFRQKGLVSSNTKADNFTAPKGASVILAGSCSEMTRAQVDYAKSRIPNFKLNVGDILARRDIAKEVLNWARPLIQHQEPIMVYSTASPDDVKATRSGQNKVDVGEKVEAVIGEIASGLRKMGTKRFVVAGGETSGAVINSLKVRFMEIGPEIAPGVPWTKSVGSDPMALALKSGNFGDENFFLKAFNQLEQMDVEG